MDYAKALWELEQIKRLKARYYRLQDENRWEEWSMLLTEDCEVADPRDVNLYLKGRKAAADRTAELAATSARAHRGTMPDIELIDETTARGTWALHCASTFDTPGGQEHCFIYGYYTDEYRKEPDGEWRIRRMRYESDMVIMSAGAMAARV
jgi:ketosteroid isomerase-like protein